MRTSFSAILDDTFLTRLLLSPKGMKIASQGDEKVLLFMYQSTNVHKKIYSTKKKRYTVYIVIKFHGVRRQLGKKS